MSKLYEKLETCLASVRQKTDFKPEVALSWAQDLVTMQMRLRLKHPSIIQISGAFRPQQ